MKKKTVWANCLVRNEERWIWYAISSVIDFMDKILVWDTGSTDRTVEVIKTIKSPKIEFKEFGEVTRENYPQARQTMLEQTQSDWLFLLDGDEIWRKEDIKRVVEAIQEKGDQVESVVVKTINFVGDIYHYQEEEAGRYEIAGRKGHYNLRAMNMRIPGLHAAGPHGVQGYFDKDGLPIQERDPQKILFVDAVYFHATHLPRTSVFEKEKEVPLRTQKRKYELGIPFPEDFAYPEVFYCEATSSAYREATSSAYLPRPEIVPHPWVKMNQLDWFRAAIQTPFKKLKRRIFQ